MAWKVNSWSNGETGSKPRSMIMSWERSLPGPWNEKNVTNIENLWLVGGHRMKIWTTIEQKKKNFIDNSEYQPFPLCDRLLCMHPTSAEPAAQILHFVRFRLIWKTKNYRSIYRYVNNLNK